MAAGCATDNHGYVLSFVVAFYFDDQLNFMPKPTIFRSLCYELAVSRCVVGVRFRNLMRSVISLMSFAFLWRAIIDSRKIVRYHRAIFRVIKVLLFELSTFYQGSKLILCPSFTQVRQVFQKQVLAISEEIISKTAL